MALFLHAASCASRSVRHIHNNNDYSCCCRRQQQAGLSSLIEPNRRPANNSDGLTKHTKHFHPRYCPIRAPVPALAPSRRKRSGLRLPGASSVASSRTTTLVSEILQSSNHYRATHPRLDPWIVTVRSQEAVLEFMGSDEATVVHTITTPKPSAPARITLKREIHLSRSLTSSIQRQQLTGAVASRSPNCWPWDNYLLVGLLHQRPTGSIRMLRNEQIQNI
eukprot:COSAG02_NODE_10_length_59045_cov_19.973365_8_plen_221_part_00